MFKEQSSLIKLGSQTQGLASFLNVDISKIKETIFIKLTE